MSPLDRRQRLFLAAIITVAAVLRFREIGTLSLSHFDEGIYLSNGASVAAQGLYAFLFAQPLQSPPLLPWIFGALFQITQTTWPTLPMLFSATLGALSVPLLFAIARRWEGNPFGLYAAALLALSDFHTAYSRMVLTDAPLTFWFLLTVYCVTRLHGACETSATPPRKAARIKRGKRQTKFTSFVRFPFNVALWTVLAMIAGAAAWNTKYNGWLILVICLVTSLFCLLLERLRQAAGIAAPPKASGNIRLIFCLLLATAGALISYLPWYLYVERHFEGGYAAVTANHRSYFSGPAAWPAHALQIITSLQALRNWGWVLTLVFTVAAFIWGHFRWATAKSQSPKTARRVLQRSLPCAFFLLLTVVVFYQSGDAAILLLGLAGIIPAIAKGTWQRMLPAVWGGTFFALAPLYHPYPRLMLPALPAGICVALALIRDIWPHLFGNLADTPAATQTQMVAKRAGRAPLVAIGVFALLSSALLVSPHPYGLIPTRGVWNRFTARQSYRAAEQAIQTHTAPDAVVICQAQPLMLMYCPRSRLVVENRSFVTQLDRIPEGTDCYLVVDFCWIHGKDNQAALAGLMDHSRGLTPVAVLRNDLNIVTLIDQLQADEIVEKLGQPLPRFTTGDGFPIPPPLAAPYEDVIVLYRIDARN